MCRKKGFTLIELMIVIAIIAIIAAIAIPGILAAIMSANERSAGGSIKTLATSQTDFRMNDRDNDGVNNFWTDDVQALYDLSDQQGNPIRLIEVTVARADGDVGMNGVRCGSVPAAAPKSGYWFCHFATYQNPGGVGNSTYDQDGAGHHNSKFGVMAKPDAYNSSGKQSFIISEGNTIFKRDNPAWSGAGPTGFDFPDSPLNSGWSPLE